MKDILLVIGYQGTLPAVLVALDPEFTLIDEQLS